MHRPHGGKHTDKQLYSKCAFSALYGSPVIFCMKEQTAYQHQAGTASVRHCHYAEEENKGPLWVCRQAGELCFKLASSLHLCKQYPKVHVKLRWTV